MPLAHQSSNVKMHVLMIILSCVSVYFIIWKSGPQVENLVWKCTSGSTAEKSINTVDFYSILLPLDIKRKQQTWQKTNMSSAENYFHSNLHADKRQWKDGFMNEQLQRWTFTFLWQNLPFKTDSNTLCVCIHSYGYSV